MNEISATVYFVRPNLAHETNTHNIALWAIGVGNLRRLVVHTPHKITILALV